MISLQGADVLQVRLNAIAREFPEQSGDVLLKHVTVEVRSREQIGWRKPLDVEKRDGLAVAVLWPYPYRGGDGTYLTRVTEQATTLMMDGLSRDLALTVAGAI